jgi:hypothetical protein
MGEQKNTLDSSQENTTKIAITSVAQFVETCAQSLCDISKTGLGPAGQTHLNSISSMLKQCSQSLRSYAAAHKQTAPIELPDDPELTPERQRRFALQDEVYLEEEQEELLKTWFNFGDGDGQVNETSSAAAMPERALVPGES